MGVAEIRQYRQMPAIADRIESQSAQHHHATNNRQADRQTIHSDYLDQSCVVFARCIAATCCIAAIRCIASNRCIDAISRIANTRCRLCLIFWLISWLVSRLNHHIKTYSPEHLEHLANLSGGFAAFKLGQKFDTDIGQASGFRQGEAASFAMSPQQRSELLSSAYF